MVLALTRPGTVRRLIVADIAPVGYGHGYARALSNQGRVLVRGRRCAVVGIVNMNLILVDVTHVPRVARGDEVLLEIVRPHRERQRLGLDRVLGQMTRSAPVSDYDRSH